MILLDVKNVAQLKDYLLEKGWLSIDEDIINVSIPGAGNMNYVVRVDTGNRTFIVKQSRPYVEKYPQVAAPSDRINTESAFYKKIESQATLKSMMPKFVGLDAYNYIMVMEDLGDSKDFSFLYDLKIKLNRSDIASLSSYLHMLHGGFYNQEGDPSFSNAEMKKLNHEHMYVYPFLENNGFDLDQVTAGLQEYAMRYKTDDDLKSEVNQIGDLYLSKGSYLLHGDFYPGSWLSTDDGIKIIDPEFCFYGLREFDVAVFTAHLILSQQYQSIIDLIPVYYENYDELDSSLIQKMAGIEIMRRLIGLAQLPLNIDLATKKTILNTAYQMIKP